MIPRQRNLLEGMLLVFTSHVIGTYYSLDILVHITGQHIVCCGIQLVQRARRDLQHCGQTNARPVIFIGTETL